MSVLYDYALTISVILICSPSNGYCTAWKEVPGPSPVHSNASLRHGPNPHGRMSRSSMAPLASLPSAQLNARFWVENESKKRAVAHGPFHNSRTSAAQLMFARGGSFTMTSEQRAALRHPLN